MNQVPWHRTEKPIRQFQHEMDRAVQRLFGNGTNRSSQTGLTAWAPHVDIEEDDKQYLVKVDLPGMDPKNVEISVVDNTLVLRGQKEEERVEKKKDYHQIERFEGQFYREILLPRGIEMDKVQAKSANGVLTVTITKKPEVQPKKIPVQAEK